MTNGAPEGSANDERTHMAGTDFEFEVAFSFHSKDEKLAQQLNDLLSDRLATFIYSEQQKVLAGRDGEKAFNEVFGSKARVVVILHREDWGQTPFTRIEETAIKNRAFSEGYDFTIFIPTDGKGAPRWVPKTQLYVGLDRWGIDAAAAVIEAAVQRQGGEARPESAADQAMRIQRHQQFLQEQKAYRDSPIGISAADNAWTILKEQVPLKVNAMAAGGLSIAARFGREQEIFVYGLGSWMVIAWRRRFANTLDESGLTVEFWNGPPPSANAYSSYDEKRHRSKSFEFDYHLLSLGSSGYVEKHGAQRQFEPPAMVEHLLKMYLNSHDRQGEGKR
jgi:hypothetical protein